MSFILDALKKSEAERQRQHAPGLANIPDPSARKSPYRWIWLVAILLGINLAALVGVLTIVNRSAEPTTTTELTSTDDTDQSATSFSDMVAEAKRTQPERTESPNAPQSNNVSAAGGQTLSAVNESYSTFADLRTQGTLSLPDLHLDIHVFSGEPAERFVFINMSKYKENGTLTEGPVIKQITPEGVILGFQGTDFLLPRE